MAEREDLAVAPVQAPDADAMADRVVAHPERVELRARQEPFLPFGEPHERPVPTLAALSVHDTY